MRWVILNKDYIEGTFVEECNNRFLCVVEIAGVKEICYVPSSSKLQHFIMLQNRKVLLKENVGKNTRTKYSLYAAKTVGGYALLNLGHINVLLERMAIRAGTPIEQIKREKRLTKYIKTDLYVDGETKQIYEAKGLLSEENTVIFPSVTVYRVEAQLINFIELLNLGYQITYCLFLLSEHISNVIFNPKEPKLMRLFISGLQCGMNLQVYRVKWERNDFVSERQIEIEEALLKSLKVNSKKPRRS